MISAEFCHQPSHPNLNLSIGYGFGMQLKELVNHGKLVPDEFIISLLSKRLEAGKEKGESGYILDGFPRTVTQAVSIFSCIL